MSPDTPGSVRVEFAINMKHEDDLTKLESFFKAQNLNVISSSYTEKTVQIEFVTGDESPNETELANIHSLQRHIERETGLIVVLKGLGQLSSAVVELLPSDAVVRQGHRVMGVVRLSQLDENCCYIDATIDNLGALDWTRSRHLSLGVHENGDLHEPELKSIGEVTVDIHDIECPSGNKLDVFSIKKTLPNCQLTSLIGNSVALTEIPGGDWPRHLCAGVIARASTINSNKKQICACSGKSLWEERIDKIQE